MKKLHEKLMGGSPLYSSWHKESGVNALHWAAFFMVAVLSAQIVFVEVEEYNLAFVGGRPNSGTPAGIIPPGLGGVFDVHPNQIVVKFKSNVGQTKRNEVLSRNKMIPKQAIRAIGAEIYTVDLNDTPEEVVQKLLAQHGADIEYAEVDFLMDPAVIPNDPNWSSQWDKQKMNFPSAWDSTTGSSNIIAAIVDTGVDCTHPDLAPNCVAGWNIFDNNSDTRDVYGHGTPVAGVVAAVGNNSIGVAGGAWNVKIMPVRSSKVDGRAYTSDTAKGIIYAADNGAKVINNSYASCGSSSIVRDAAKYASGKGAVVVYSLGNSSADTGVSTNPLECIGVTGTDSGDRLYSWSSFGTNADVSAPGCTGATTSNGGGYRSFCGTSNAAPEVSGAIALMFSANPSLTPAQVRDHLYSSSLDLGTSGWDKYFGWGRVDAKTALDKAVLNAPAPSPTPTPTPTPTPDTTAPSVPQNLSASATEKQVSLNWSASTDNVSVSGYEVYRGSQMIARTSNTGYVDTNISPQTTYSYSVRAYDSAGNVSGSSNSISVTTPVASLAVTSYSVPQKTGTSATVSWQTNLPSNGYIIWGTNKRSLNQTTSSSSAGADHSVFLSGLRTKTNYYYQVISTSSDGSQKAVSPVSSFRTDNR